VRFTCLTNIKPYSAIHRYLGWWVVMPGATALTGQIIRSDDLTTYVRAANDLVFSVANSALLDSRLAQLHPTEMSMQAAVQHLQRS
jgi:hypothetical protein